MLIEDPLKFALVIPTYEGTAFLRRCLDYLDSVGYPGQIVLSDDSSGEHRQFVQSCAERHPRLCLEAFLYPHPTRFLVKLCDTLDKLSAHYVMLCGQDDFVIAATLERLVQLLEARPELSAARGRIARFHVSRNDAEGGAGSVTLQYLRHPQRAYLDDDPVERVLGHLREYSPTLYSVQRRKAALESFRETEAATKNVVFFQYLASCITAQLGKIDCVDEMYFARQAHAQSWAAKLQRDYEHFPMLLSSPNYSRYYLEFRGALAARLGQHAASDEQSLEHRIDVAYLNLVRRSLCLTEARSAPDEEFFTRLGNQSSHESAQLKIIVECVVRHPQSY